MSEQRKSDVTISSQLQKNLINKYSRQMGFAKNETIVRPSTVGSLGINKVQSINAYNGSSMSKSKKLRSKTKSRIKIRHEMPDIDNLFHEKKVKDQVNPRRKIQLAKERGRNLGMNDLNNSISNLNLIKTTPNISEYNFISSGIL
jgi:hypothetical protein